MSHLCLAIFSNVCLESNTFVTNYIHAYEFSCILFNFLMFCMIFVWFLVFSSHLFEDFNFVLESCLISRKFLGFVCDLLMFNYAGVMYFHVHVCHLLMFCMFFVWFLGFLCYLFKDYNSVHESHSYESLILKYQPVVPEN